VLMPNEVAVTPSCRVGCAFPRDPEVIERPLLRSGQAETSSDFESLMTSPYLRARLARLRDRRGAALNTLTRMVADLAIEPLATLGRELAP